MVFNIHVFYQDFDLTLSESFLSSFLWAIREGEILHHYSYYLGPFIAFSPPC